MGSCHSITYVNDELLGDPLDVKMFESTDYILYEKTTGTNSAIGGNNLVLAYLRL